MTLNEIDKKFLDSLHGMTMPSQIDNLVQEVARLRMENRQLRDALEVACQKCFERLCG